MYWIHSYTYFYIAGKSNRIGVSQPQKATNALLRCLCSMRTFEDMIESLTSSSGHWRASPNHDWSTPFCLCLKNVILLSQGVPVRCPTIRAAKVKFFGHYRRHGTTERDSKRCTYEQKWSGFSVKSSAEQISIAETGNRRCRLKPDRISFLWQEVAPSFEAWKRNNCPLELPVRRDEYHWRSVLKAFPIVSFSYRFLYVLSSWELPFWSDQNAL